MNATLVRGASTVLAVLVLLLLGSRYLLLHADVPPWFAPADLGLHLDDGYKSLAPRNLIEHGHTHWNPHDEYPGWYRASPLTQRLYQFAFSVGGVELVSIRAVGVSFFVALVVLFVLALRNAYPTWALALGAALLCLEPMLYHFSRVALFEVPLAFFVALGCFSVHRARGPLLQVILVAATAALAWRLVKPSGFLYLTPALAALTGLALLQRGFSARKLIMIVIVVSSVVGALLLRTRHIWSGSFYLDEFGWLPQRLLTSGLVELTPLIMAAALLCVVHGVATRAREYLGDGYRLVLVSTLVGVPLILACFETPAPRYYTAMVVCAPLLLVEHAARGLWHWRSVASPSLWARMLVAVLTVLLVWYLLRALDYVVLRHLPVRLGESPGVLPITMYRHFAPLALLSFVGAFWFQGRLFRPRLVKPALVVLTLAFAGFGLAEQVRTLSSPTFDGRQIRERLVAVTPLEASIAGDWAPILTFGTGRKVLYANDVFNPADRFGLLRPDYFLSAQSWQDEANLRALVDLATTVPGEPIFLGSMLGREVRLYPMHYLESDAP